ncbi:MAG: tellurite resistance TerB family protein [Alphaproteobacteria bacterium]|nr:tellurite resistance TerB family protein [Alphaproteobacteria bacterium]
MLDTKNLLANIDSNGLVGKILGGMATKNFAAGLLTGGVATSLLGGGKDTVETVAKVGGLALLGTLAYKAFGNYQQQKAAGGNASVVNAVKHSATCMATQASSLISGLLAGNQAPSVSLQAPASANTELPLAIIRAMIAAAKADGHMDAAESQKIIGQLEAAGVGAHEKALLIQEMANMQDVNSIAAAAKTQVEAAQIYLAALMVCDSQCMPEQEYLASLARALKLEPAFTNSLQEELHAMSTQKAA